MMGGSLVLMAKGEPHWSPFTHTSSCCILSEDGSQWRAQRTLWNCCKIDNVNIKQFIYKNTVHWRSNNKGKILLKHKMGHLKFCTSGIHSGFLNKDLTDLSYFIENCNLVRRSGAPFVRSAKRARTYPGRAPWKMREFHILSVKTGMQPLG
jgi:hypothetical protein